jgi:hypothetical protein
MGIPYVKFITFDILFLVITSDTKNNDNQLSDQRNDKRIIAVLQKDKKLIKIDL